MARPSGFTGSNLGSRNIFLILPERQFVTLRPKVVQVTDVNSEILVP